MSIQRFLIALIVVFTFSCNTKDQSSENSSSPKEDTAAVVATKDTVTEITAEPKSTFEEKYGIAMIGIDDSKTNTLHIKQSLGDEYGSTVALLDENGEVDVKVDGKDVDWFQPYTLVYDYHILHFCVTDSSNGWYQIIVNQEEDKRMWLELNEGCRVMSWDNFIQREASNIVRLSKVKTHIYSESGTGSEEVDYEGNDQFSASKISGEWMQLEPGGCREGDPNFKSGWIRWRDENELHVEFYFGC
jgi:hypothetical protein